MSKMPSEKAVENVQATCEELRDVHEHGLEF